MSSASKLKAISITPYESNLKSSTTQDTCKSSIEVLQFDSNEQPAKVPPTLESSLLALSTKAKLTKITMHYIKGALTLGVITLL